MSRCGINRWGPGTTCERIQNTEAVKEMNDRMKALQAERLRQDAIWGDPVAQTQAPPQSKQGPQNTTHGKPSTSNGHHSVR